MPKQSDSNDVCRKVALLSTTFAPEIKLNL